MTRIPEALPPGLVAYGRSPDFTPQTLPPKLEAAHSTKAGTWGLLHVLDGKVLYRLEPPHSDQRLAAAGETIAIEPEIPHRVAFVEPGRFYVEFYRATDRVAQSLWFMRRRTMGCELESWRSSLAINSSQ